MFDTARSAIIATCRTSNSPSNAAQLWMLQTRSGKRTAKAALRDRGRHGAGGSDRRARRRCCASIRPRSISCSTRRSIPTADARRHRQGAAGIARRGVGRGWCSTPTPPRRAAETGEKVILVRTETSPEDIHGMHAAQGHPHRARRHDQPRRGRRARHGAAVRVGRGIAVDRRARQGDARRRRARCARATRSPSTARPAR